MDPHSHAGAHEPRIRHIQVRLEVDFHRHVLVGSAVLHLERCATFTLDTRDLVIHDITREDGSAVRFELGRRDPILGQPLAVLEPVDRVRIRYETSPSASALQWLRPEQTSGGQHPFVYSQSQPIHARSFLPCQDTPSIRFTFEAEIVVPRPLTALMAAEPVGASIGDTHADFRFRMPQPIPSYLVAFAVGDLVRRPLGPRSEVWAEEAVVDLAAAVLQETEGLITTAETLFGPYVWDRFDLLIMPPSFPYGGMENPRLTFVTPTSLAPDRSLVSVVAHELAHAWTGNLVTNESAEHFWLNEGFTVYAERRIIEALHGTEEASIQAAIGRRDLMEDIHRLERRDPRLTCLRTHLEGEDPDLVFSTVPYEKGFLFLVWLEREVGRDRFDDFLLDYIHTHRFASISTEGFVDFLRDKLPEARELPVDSWLFRPGLPKAVPEFASTRLDHVRSLASALSRGQEVDQSVLSTLSGTEWQVLLHHLSPTLPSPVLAWLDEKFALSSVPNAEIRCAFLALTARSAYRETDDAIRETLQTVGRMKFLRPLYEGLLARGPDGRKLAEGAFQAARSGYHPVAVALVEDILGGGRS
ncbi:MAG: M1 family metallopeptidase [Myxococcota bacterium]